MTDRLTAAQIAEIEARAPYESALLRTWAENDRKRGASIPAEAMERIAEMIDASPALVRDLRAAREALADERAERIRVVSGMELDIAHAEADRDRARARAAQLARVLEDQFMALGRAGGNTIGSPLRPFWEAARAALPEETSNG